MKVRNLQESEPSNGSGSQSLGLELLLVFKTLPIASANAVALASCDLEPGVPLSVGLMCTDLCCPDILVGVGGWVGVWATGVEFHELSRRVKSNIPAC